MKYCFHIADVYIMDQWERVTDPRILRSSVDTQHGGMSSVLCCVVVRQLIYNNLIITALTCYLQWVVFM